MTISIVRNALLLTIGLLLCILGCADEGADEGVDVLSLNTTLLPTEAEKPAGMIPLPTEVEQSADMLKLSFENKVLPILTAKCAFAGCHDAAAHDGIDYRTYESFLAGGEDGPTFIPGYAEESEIVEEIVEGRMPPGGPRLPDTEISVIIDWINQQERPADFVRHDDHDDDHDDHDHDHDDHDDDDHDDDDHDDDHDDHDDDDDDD